nr:MAG TPA: hypothetical protein [Caudoviricetes sp.]
MRLGSAMLVRLSENFLNRPMSDLLVPTELANASFKKRSVFSKFVTNKSFLLILSISL